MQEAAPQTRRFYVLKVKGKAKIPDYIQLRDADFTLVGYFRPGRNNKTGRHADANQSLFQLVEAKAEHIPFGVVMPLDLSLEELAAAGPEPRPE